MVASCVISVWQDGTFAQASAHGHVLFIHLQYPKVGGKGDQFIEVCNSSYLPYILPYVLHKLKNG